METNTHTARRQTKSGEISVTVSNSAWQHEITADGAETGITEWKTSSEVLISLIVNGKRIVTASEVSPLNKRDSGYANAVRNGCVAMVGRIYINQAVADKIADALAEAHAAAPKTAKQIEIEQTAANAAAAAEAYRNSAAGQAAAQREAKREWLKREMDRPDSDN